MIADQLLDDGDSKWRRVLLRRCQIWKRFGCRHRRLIDAVADARPGCPPVMIIVK